MLLNTRDDIPSRNQPTNTFIALRPPWPIAEEFCSRAAGLCSSARIIGSRRPFFILHITVLPIGRHMGRLPHLLLEKIDAAVSMVQLPAIEIVLDEVGSFETRKDNAPFVLEGGELADVWGLRLAALGALRVKGLNIPARPTYSPHMTLAYARRRSPRIGIEPFSWKACEFQLIESWVDQTKYVELARWKLWEDEPQSLRTQPIRPAVLRQLT